MTTDKIMLPANTERANVILLNDEYITITINGILQVTISRDDNFVYNIDLWSIQNNQLIGDTYVTDEDVLSGEEFERVHPD